MNKTGTRTIETHRLILRQFRTEDAREMFANWASDPEVTRFLTWPPHPNAEATRMLLETWTSRYGDGGYFNWAMEWKETGQVIGNISVVEVIDAIDRLELGWVIGKKYWGNGYTPEAALKLIDFLFDKVGANCIAAGHDVNNPKSGRVMQKIGMKYEGILRQSGRNNQGIVDMAHYSIIKSEHNSILRTRNDFS